MTPAFEIEQHGTTIAISPCQPMITAQQMRDLIDEVTPRLEQKEIANVVFNMASVEYLDSSCMARLIALLQAARKVNGKVSLVRCQPNVTFLLKMSRLDKLFDLCDNMDQAMGEEEGEGLRDEA